MFILHPLAEGSELLSSWKSSILVSQVFVRYKTTLAQLDQMKHAYTYRKLQPAFIAVIEKLSEYYNGVLKNSIYQQAAILDP